MHLLEVEDEHLTQEEKNNTHTIYFGKGYVKNCKKQTNWCIEHETSMLLLDRCALCSK